MMREAKKELESPLRAGHLIPGRDATSCRYLLIRWRLIDSGDDARVTAVRYPVLVHPGPCSVDAAWCVAVRGWLESGCRRRCSCKQRPQRWERVG